MSITIDEMLDLVSPFGTERANGNANHGPMAAEALFKLGRDEAVLPWVENYKSGLIDHPKPTTPISRSDWRESLGDSSRLSDWTAFFDRELEEAPWQDVLSQWVPHLAPAVMAAATHGLLRTSHAARSLSAVETPQRLHELAQGLGYWAARYQVLPGSPSPFNSGFSPRSAVEQVDRLHGPDFDGGGGISNQVMGLDDHPKFAVTIDLVDTEGDLSAFISNLTETFAGVYLANQKNLIAFVHTVTAPSALRNIAPYLTEESSRLAARYAWQACASIYSWYSAAPPLDTSELAIPIEDQEELTDRAVAAGGAHSIKFTEACLREYSFNPKPVYLVAARDAAERVGPVEFYD